MTTIDKTRLWLKIQLMRSPQFCKLDCSTIKSMLNVLAFSFYLKLEDYSRGKYFKILQKNCRYCETQLPTAVLKSGVLQL